MPNFLSLNLQGLFKIEHPSIISCLRLQQTEQVDREYIQMCIIADIFFILNYLNEQ